MASGLKREKVLRGPNSESPALQEDLVLVHLLTRLAFNQACESLTALDQTRSGAEWSDWLMEQAEKRLYEIETEEELEAVFTNKLL